MGRTGGSRRGREYTCTRSYAHRHAIPCDRCRYVMAASRSRARAHAKLRDQERRLVSSSALFIVCDSSAADVLRLVAQREAILYTSTRRLGKQCYCSSLSALSVASTLVLGWGQHLAPSYSFTSYTPRVCSIFEHRYASLPPRRPRPASDAPIFRQPRRAGATPARRRRIAGRPAGNMSAKSGGGSTR